MQLTDASGGGTIGLDRVANVIIPANDNPYGTVAFVQSVYRVQEPLERSSCANITVRRRYMRWLLASAGVMGIMGWRKRISCTII